MTVEEALPIVKKLLEPRRLSQIQERVFRQSWEGQSYQEIASNYGYDHGYVRDVGSELWQMLSEAFGEKVTKKNFQLILKQCWESLCARESQMLQGVALKAIAAVGISAKNYQDWGEAINVDLFYGRTEELSILEQWIVQDRCRLVVLSGMGGIGKTALAVRIAQQIQGEFEYLIWRSLRNAPLIQDLLTELIRFLSQQQETVLPETVDGKVLRLLECLRSSRCLLVLDNAETILSSGDHTNCYREGYEGYGQLFRCVAETTHHSCLLLTSREQPRGWAANLGEALPVRSLQLAGLPTAAGREIFQARGKFWGSETEWRVLIEHYAGNPLALKMVAPAIRNFFGSKVANFLELLKQGTLVFNDIRNVLDRQCNRLSDLEKQVMYWLAINREWISILDLHEDMVPPPPLQELLEALLSLQRRSLIEVNSARFTQQPVVMEYVTEQLVKQVEQEVITQELCLLNSHALIKAQGKDYIRESQIRVILKPAIDRLRAKYQTPKDIEQKLQQVLYQLQAKSAGLPGYSAGNLLNILGQLKVDLTGYNFSYLCVWQACLQQMNLHRVNFAYADLAKSVFAETLGKVLSVAFSPDGKLLATSNSNGQISLWQVKSGQQLLSWKGHNGWAFSVAFSPDGKLLATGDLSGQISLWQVTNGGQVLSWKGHTDMVIQLPLVQMLIS